MLRVFRLTTGEDVVAFKEKSNTPEFTKVKRPFVIIPMRGDPGKPVTLGFHPYLPYTKDTEVEIKSSAIIAEATPDETIENAYNQNTSQTIITPLKPKLVT